MSRTITKEVYTYNELSNDAKETAKQWYLGFAHEANDFTEYLIEDLHNLFGDNNLDVEYSLGYSQGDGLNIYGTINAEQILGFMNSDVAGEFSKQYANALTDDDRAIILEYCKDYHTVTIPKNQSLYSYCVADSIDIADEWYTQLSYYNGYDRVDVDVLKKFENIVIDIFTKLCKTYEDMGYEYFYEVSEEEMQDMCDANGWEFYEDGSLY